MSVIKHRAFSESFNREAADRVTTSGMSARAVALEMDLHEPVLRRWITKLGTQATGMLRRLNTQAMAPFPSALVAGSAHLRCENDRLRMEYDIQKTYPSSSERPPDQFRVRR